MINDEEARRRETHHQYFFRLCKIKQDLDELRSSTIDDDTLRSLGVYRAEELDVDESNAGDLGPRYFSPLPTDYLPEIAELCQTEDRPDRWGRRCIAGTEAAEREAAANPFSACDCCSPFHEAGYTLDWFCHTFWFHMERPEGPMNGVEWDFAGMEGRDRLPLFQGYLEERVPGVNHNATFQGQVAMMLADRSQPHSKCFVADSETAAEPELLRSELVTALTVLKRHARRMEFIDHHTLPVLVTTFQHDNFVRVSQAHFDGERVVVRASRQLVLLDEVGGGDMLLLARWMGSRPAGQTRFGQAPVCAGEGGEEGNPWRHGDGAAISVKG